MYFYYGADGVVGFKLNGVNYVYKKNAQNDIIGIYSTDGTQICKYFYDAWGNQVVKYLNSSGEYVTIEPGYQYNDTTDTNRFVAYKNPFRYRSYYYDFETGLYYLNSRYYDPELGRFINADDISVLSESKDFINGLNLYSYCNNNPVIYSDKCGHAWWHWLIGFIFLAVAIVATVVTAGAAAGTIAAAIHGIAVTATITGITSAAVGFISGGVTFNNGNLGWSWEGAAEGFMWGSISGVVSGAISGGLGGIGSSLTKPIRALAQAGINGLTAFAVTSIQGLITNSFSLHDSMLSFIFGALGGFLGITKLGSGIKNIFTGIGLSLTENFINEIVEYILSKSNKGQLILLTNS